MADVTARWWRATRTAGPTRLTYEIGLTILVCALTVGTAAVLDQRDSVRLLVIAVSCLTLVPLRLVYPATTLLVGSVSNAFTGNENTFLLMVLSMSAGYRILDVRRAYAVFGAALGVWLAEAWLVQAARTLEDLVLMAAVFVVLAVLPGWAAHLVGRRRRLVAAMHRRNEQLHAEQTAIARQAQARERARIARDLHDSLGHKLTLISLYAGTFDTVDERQRRETMVLLRETSTSAMGELRQILGLLRSDADDASPAQPLTGVEELARTARSTGIEVDVVRTGEVRVLPAMAEHAGYRVVQEGLTNAVKHARGAPVRVEVRYERDALTVEVINGPGLPHHGPTSGQGLIGMAERVRLAGGTFYDSPTADGGFRLAAVLPYQPTVPPADGPAPGRAAGPPIGAGEHLPLPQRRSRAGLIVTSVLVAGTAAVCVGGFAVILMVDTVDRETFDAVSVGEAESRVRDRLPDDDHLVDDAVGGAPVPVGATCLDYPANFAEQSEDDSDRDLIYRFCFSGGALVFKEAFYERGAS